jgi:RNA polymerase sigma-70 factor (ECF subfamily)
MTPPLSTCWTVIRGAAAGDSADRDEFARRYSPVIRAYLSARWRNSPYLRHLDDTIQEVFVECFQPDGVLDRADPAHGGFRAFLYGVVRNVALRVEERGARERVRRPADEVHLDQLAADDTDLSRIFDRAWAKTLLREAAVRQAERALDEPARRRVELLRLRFHDGLPIREIARRWNVDAATLHHDYAKARQEFRAALREVMVFHHPGSAADIERACSELLTLLG